MCRCVSPSLGQVRLTFDMGQLTADIDEAGRQGTGRVIRDQFPVPRREGFLLAGQMKN